MKSQCLQSLQGNDTPVPWNPRIVSVKPSLASVPEGGPSEAGVNNQAVNLMPMSMFNPGADMQPVPTHHEGFGYMGQDPSCGMGMHPMPLPGMAPLAPQGMFPMPMFPQQPFRGQVRE